MNQRELLCITNYILLKQNANVSYERVWNPFYKYIVGFVEKKNYFVNVVLTYNIYPFLRFIYKYVSFHG